MKIRKYDTANKRNITIVLCLCAVILIVFSIFMKRVNDLDKKEYDIEVNSVLYDKDKNMWNLDSTGTLKIKWSGAYYMNYKDEEIALNKQVVVYNNAAKTLNLYGTLYKINKDASVETLNDETIIEDTIVPKFYKLDDRKYLLIASDIKSGNGKFNAENYLIVELDKIGNATLTNNKINMKTLSETLLTTSSYTFDIANEILNFGEEDIDLKKIIGSTNEYKPKESTEENDTPNNGDSAGENSGTGGSSGDSAAGNGTDGSGEGSEGTGGETIDTNVYQDKNFSVVKNTVGTNYLNIDYSIYDPKDEYQNVFLEIENDNTKSIETYYLAKNGTNLKISGLEPNTKYNVIYKYSYFDEVEGLKYEVFDTNYSITTRVPETHITVSKLTNKEVHYAISENEPLMYGAKVELIIDEEIKDSYIFTSENPTSTFKGVFNLSEYEEINYITIKTTSITYKTGEVIRDVVIKVKN